MRCKAKREMIKPVFVTTKTGNKAAKGQCKDCGTNMYSMLPKTDVSAKPVKKSAKSVKSVKTVKSVKNSAKSVKSVKKSAKMVKKSKK